MTFPGFKVGAACDKMGAKTSAARHLQDTACEAKVGAADERWFDGGVTQNPCRNQTFRKTRQKILSPKDP
jgi:hypothetical protein